MQKPLPSTPRESTEAMVRTIGHELAEIERAIGYCQGDGVAEPLLTGTWMAHLGLRGQQLPLDLRRAGDLPAAGG
jgi:hypothetical protein